MKNRTLCFLLLGLLGLLVSLFLLWPRSAEYYFNRGSEKLTDNTDDWFAKYDLNGALADFDHAIKLNPRFTAAYVSRAFAEEIKNDLSGALNDYSRAIELSPEDAHNYMQRADIKATQHDLNGALADYERAIELKPTAKAYMARSKIREQQGDLTAALTEEIRMIEELAAPFKGSILANEQFFARRSAVLSSKVFLKQYNSALELNPTFSWGYYYRGVTRSLQKDWDGALLDFRRCQDFPDTNLKDYAAIHLWLLRAQKGKTTEANQELSAYLNTRTTRTPRDWEGQIAKFLLDRLSEADFSATINSTNAEKERSQFWYYSGMKQLLAGD